MWNQTNYDFGETASKKEIKVSFIYTGEKKIESIKASCGCTVPTFNSETGELTAIYTPGTIPAHLQETGQKISKNITVTFDDGTEQVLSITGLLKTKK